MIVKVFTIDSDTMAETFLHHSDLADCLPEADDYWAAYADIVKAGRAWIGGGAAPLFLLTRAEP
jgi:hypothetical protein